MRPTPCRPSGRPWRGVSRWPAAFLPLLLAAPPVLGQANPPTFQADSAGSWAFVNGQWFDGARFRARTMHAVAGRFTDTAPSAVDRTLDLRGGYAIPPFGEAHNHNLTTASQVAEMLPRYLTDGVFYVKMQSSLPRLTDPIRSEFNHPASIDVVFANGPLTATGGHPVALRERLWELGVYPGIKREELEGQGHFQIDSREQLDRKWPTILGLQPDFIKVILVYSEEFERRKDDTAFFGRKGLDPALLPPLVEKAHVAGLRVSAHVTTATDFHHAVTAGADEIAHLPGMSAPTQIREQDARLAAARGITVITTASLAERVRDREDLYRRIREAQADNLRLLHRAGVPLAVGSDDVEQTSTEEVEYLRSLGVFDELTLLCLWTVNGPRTIFPSRRIGALEPGYEASFLVLAGNPLEDFANVRRVRMRFKQGVLLEP